MAVATSSGRDSVQNKLYNHGDLFSLMSHIVMGSTDPEVKFGKPAPDCFLVCAKRFPDNPNPEQVSCYQSQNLGGKLGVFSASIAPT